MIKRSIKIPVSLPVKSYLSNVYIPTDLSNWILANGTWNDDGIWDDDAVWNDGV